MLKRILVLLTVLLVLPGVSFAQDAPAAAESAAQAAAAPSPGDLEKRIVDLEAT
jgi:hypothetical protein